MISSAVADRDRVREAAAQIEQLRAECRAAQQQRAPRRWWSQKLPEGGAIIRDAETEEIVARVPAGIGDEVAILIVLSPVNADNNARAAAELASGDAAAAGRTLRPTALVLRPLGVGGARC